FPTLLTPESPLLWWGDTGCGWGKKPLQVSEVHISNISTCMHLLICYVKCEHGCAFLEDKPRIKQAAENVKALIEQEVGALSLSTTVTIQQKQAGSWRLLPLSLSNGQFSYCRKVKNIGKSSQCNLKNPVHVA
ncbi:hypothetical protein Celaphus_00018778, partial [Cervus elaphus hippelaphus]